MKYVYLLIIPFMLACGVMAEPPIAGGVIDTSAQTPEFSEKQPQISTATAQATEITANAEMSVTGCWNIRSAPSVDEANKLGEQCGGSVTVMRWSANGFLLLADDVYICNQAVGWSDECK